MLESMDEMKNEVKAEFEVQFYARMSNKTVLDVVNFKKLMTMM